ncbi:MAG TPA: cupin domain-containing protein, partial [Cyclobacteriaceae bacterium]
MKHPILSTLFLLSIPLSVIGQGQPVQSDVYPWSQVREAKKENRDKKEILEGSSTFLESIEIHVSTLAPGKASSGEHTPADAEKLVIVKEGRLRVTQNNITRVLGPGSVALTLPGEEHSLANGGDAPV